MANDSDQGADGGTVTLPVQREELRVTRRVVETGGVRVHKRVTERAQRIDETLWRDELEVRRVAIDKVVAPGAMPAARYEGSTLVVPVLEEVLVVEKRYRIKEELRITKVRRPRQHAETVRLKSEELNVERFGDGAQASPNKAV